MRATLLFTLKLAVSISLLYFVLRGTDVPALVDRLRGLDPLWLAATVLAYAGTVVISTWRWQVLLRAQHIDVPFRTLWNSFWVALYFNNFLPSNIGGDVVRIADTARAAGSKTIATTIVLIDRGLGLAALVFIAAAGSFAATLDGLHVPGEAWIWVAGAGGMVALAPILVAPRSAAHLLLPLKAVKHPWVQERVTRLEDALDRFGNQRSALVCALGGAIVVQGMMVVLCLLSARALDIPLAFKAAAVLVPISLVVQMAPVAINGFGVREAVFIFFFNRFGLSSEAAIALSLTLTGVTMALSLCGGLIFLSRKEMPVKV